MKPVIAPPLLPYPSGNDIKSLRAFDADLRRALVEILTQYAFRLNGMLPADGSEPVTNYLQIQRQNVPEQFFRLGPSDSVGHNIKGFSLPANAKSFVFNATTDDADTAPSGGENSYSFQIRGVEKLRIDDSANAVEVKSGVLLDVQSGQVKFPATQVPSTNANTIDDYEENTWTPTINFNGGTTGITYSVQAGVYVKIGQLVFVQGRIILTNKGSSTGAARIAGLPFASHGNSHNYTPISVGYFQNFVALPGALSGYIEISNSYINLTAHQATGVGGLNETHFSNTSDIIFSAVYRASA